MDQLFVAVLCLYLFWEAVELVLTTLNLNHLKKHGNEVPDGFGEMVDSEVLGKMARYTVAKTKVEIVASLYSTALTAAFFFAGGLVWYDAWITAKGWSFVVSGVCFFLFLTLVVTLIKLPFGLYSTFRVEKEYGFNKQTLGLWALDTLKGLLLSVVLNSLLLAAAFWLISRFPENWWFLTWLVFFGFSIFLMYLSPYVIEPLFNKFEPVGDDELEGAIRSLMEKAGLNISKVFKMDASRRSTHSNAYFSGIGHVKRIVLFDTLLTTNSRDEILAILAHEAGHWRKRHIVKRLVVMELLALAGMYFFFLLVQSDVLAQAFGLAAPGIPAKLLLAGLVGSLIVFPFQPLSSYFSRKHEREADDFALSLTGKPEAMAAALKKLSRDNLANLFPHPLYAAFHYSHPPLVKRVERLLKEKS